MEKDKEEQLAATFSWRCDSHIRPHQSQWLQTTLSDLDKKTKAMLNLIIQDDGDSFAKRAEMYYQRRPQLIEMMEDLCRSYRYLAEKYDKLKSLFSSNYPFKQIQQILQNGEEEHCLENSELEEPNSDIESDITGNLNKGGVKIKEIINDFGFDCNVGSDLQREKLWTELRLKVSELIEDNLHQQAELIRRNDEKRETIKDLCSQIDRLMDENSALKSSLPGNKVDLKRNLSQVSRLKKSLLGRFTSS